MRLSPSVTCKAPPTKAPPKNLDKNNLLVWIVPIQVWCPHAFIIRPSPALTAARIFTVYFVLLLFFQFMIIKKIILERDVHDRGHCVQRLYFPTARMATLSECSLFIKSDNSKRRSLCHHHSHHNHHSHHSRPILNNALNFQHNLFPWNHNWSSNGFKI